MLDIAVALGLVVLFSAAALFGFTAKSRIPEAHRSKDFYQTVQLVMSLLITFAALVLGLLTTSVKASFDKAEQDRVAYAADLTQLDLCLRNYGPDALPARDRLKSYVGAVIASTWPAEPPPHGFSYPDVRGMNRTGPIPALAGLMNEVGLEILRLAPADPFRRAVLDDCHATYRTVLGGRWNVVEDVYASMSVPFYCAVVFWLAVVFAGFGLLAPLNPTVLVVLGLGAVSVTSDLVLVLDMDRPYLGVFSIPSTAMRAALAQMLAS